MDRVLCPPPCEKTSPDLTGGACASGPQIYATDAVKGSLGHDAAAVVVTKHLVASLTRRTQGVGAHPVDPTRSQPGGAWVAYMLAAVV